MLYWVYMAGFANVGAAGIASVRQDQGCPILDTDSSSQLQQTHHRAQLSPAAKLVSLWKNKKGKELPSSEGCGRNSTMKNNVKKRRRGERVAPGARAEIILQPMERITVEQMDISREEMQLVESSHWTKFFPERLQPMKQAQAGIGEQCEEQEVAGGGCYLPSPTPFPIPLHCLGWRR